MGGAGSDAAIEAADVVIMDDQLLKIATAVRIAIFTRRIVPAEYYPGPGCERALSRGRGLGSGFDLGCPLC